MQRLEFINNVHGEGINSTMRLGTKWLDRVLPGDLVALAEPDPDSKLLQGRVRYLMVCEYDDIPEFAFEQEHDPECQTRSGLDMAMKRAYGEVPLDEDIVTIIGYEVM